MYVVVAGRVSVVLAGGGVRGVATSQAASPQVLAHCLMISTFPSCPGREPRPELIFTQSRALLGGSQTKLLQFCTLFQR